MIQVKIFGGNRYQMIEQEFNEWASEVNPYIVKTVIDTAPIPKADSGHSLFFTMAIFYQENNQVPEMFALNKRGVRNG